MTINCVNLYNFENKYPMNVLLREPLNGNHKYIIVSQRHTIHLFLRVNLSNIFIFPDTIYEPNILGAKYINVCLGAIQGMKKYGSTGACSQTD